MKTNDQIILEAMASRIRELEYGIKLRDMALGQTVHFISTIHRTSLEKDSNGRPFLDDYVDCIDENMSNMSGDIQTNELASLCYRYIDANALSCDHTKSEVNHRLNSSGYQYDK